MVCDSGCRGFEPHQSPHYSSNALGLILQVFWHPDAMEIKELSTLDGRRTKLSDLNLGAVPDQDKSGGVRGRLASVLHGISLTLAGMFTGLSCYGTPNSVQKSQSERRVSTERGSGPV